MAKNVLPAAPMAAWFVTINSARDISLFFGYFIRGQLIWISYMLPADSRSRWGRETSGRAKSEAEAVSVERRDTGRLISAAGIACKGQRFNRASWPVPDEARSLPGGAPCENMP
ncbi:MAG: hypothetical protein ACLP1D_00115 [Xanthobacteraceae bacterium]